MCIDEKKHTSSPSPSHLLTDNNHIIIDQPLLK